MKAKKNLRAGKGELAGVAELRARFGYKPDDPGFSVDEYAARYGLTHGGATAEIRRMTEAGELIKGGARRADGKGTRRRVNVFRMK